MGAEVCLELCADVDGGGLPRAVLHHEEQLGHDLDDVAGLEDEVPLAPHRLGGQAVRDVGLRPQLTGRR